MIIYDDLHTDVYRAVARKMKSRPIYVPNSCMVTGQSIRLCAGELRANHMVAKPEYTTKLMHDCTVDCLIVCSVLWFNINLLTASRYDI